MLKMPERIKRLDEIANNLWWSWHNDARQLFRSLDYLIWRESGHNPIKQLREVSPDTLQAAANDPSFLNMYDSVVAAFDNYLNTANTWFATHCPKLSGNTIAYFSMEYAIHNSLPIYAGGLGILAGDICKTASDMGIPMVAVGFMYPQGYFHQRVEADGTQREFSQELDFDELPITRLWSPSGNSAIAEVELGGSPLAIGAWQIRVGRTNIYLLDTNLEQNPPQYQHLSARLYTADREQRLQQEIVLGIGGIRVLRALGINPTVWHANEGHTAFMMLERIREEIATGSDYKNALDKVMAATVFTTHTPVMAGHDVFSAQLIDKYFGRYWNTLGIDRERFYQLGWQDNFGGNPGFNMTALALKTSGQRLGVSRLHGKVSRKMWHNLWPDVAEEQVPISYVTNGVHTSSWIAPELAPLYEKYVGKNWPKLYDDQSSWQGLLDIPDAELWAVRLRLKYKLVGAIRERMRRQWLEEGGPRDNIMAMGALLDPEALTIVFTRRFTVYKRPTLIFRDMRRLKRIISSELHPVQIIFAGKPHPADAPAKYLLKQVYNIASDPGFRGRIAFVEDYDMHLARYMVHGADIWLNTPRRLQEACGTSGMKAVLNGALHLSVRDGWWHEGYNGKNGWAIGQDLTTMSPSEEDETDAESLYRLLEEEIIPLYYARDRVGVPHGWLSMVRQAMYSVVPAFCGRRMMKEYTEKAYQFCVAGDKP